MKEIYKGLIIFCPVFIIALTGFIKLIRNGLKYDKKYHKGIPWMPEKLHPMQFFCMLLSLVMLWVIGAFYISEKL